MKKKFISSLLFVSILSVSTCYATGFIMPCSDYRETDYGTVSSYDTNRNTISTTANFEGTASQKLCVYVSSYSYETSSCAHSGMKKAVAMQAQSITLPHTHSFRGGSK